LDNPGADCPDGCPCPDFDCGIVQYSTILIVYKYGGYNGVPLMLNVSGKFKFTY